MIRIKKIQKSVETGGASSARASGRSRDFLTATDVYKFMTCPHWPYFDRFATTEEAAMRRDLTEGEKRRLDDGYLHEREVMELLMAGREIAEMATEGNPEALFEATREAMARGAAYIYQGTLLDGDWLGRPDLLVRTDGASNLGNWHYRPLDIKSAHDLGSIHRMELAFYAVLLKRIQGVMPETSGIINRDHEEHWFDPTSELEKFEEILGALTRIRSGEKPDPVVRKTCFDTGPWGNACLADAQKTNDIALLFNVDVNKLRGLRDLGIRTVAEAAAMDPGSYVGAAPGLTEKSLAVIRAQARSLFDHLVIIKEPVRIPEVPFEIYFDIESDLPNDVDYLYGFLVRDGSESEAKYVRFLAERPEDESKMWREFLAWIPTLPENYVVYHYASFETMRLRLLAGRYGGSDSLAAFMSRMVDLKPCATKQIAYPLYFYGLKYICKFLGFHWRGDIKTGGESIDWYENWCATGKRALLDEIIGYNEDDVRATAFLKDWMSRYAIESAEYAEPYPWGA
jgi:predicted RecB family nuclease